MALETAQAGPRQAGPHQAEPREAAPQRVAFLLDNLSGGGAERVVLEMASGFVQLGYKVDLLVCELQGELCGNVPPGVNLIVLEPAGKLAGLGTAVRRLSFLVPFILFLPVVCYLFIIIIFFFYRFIVSSYCAFSFSSFPFYVFIAHFSLSSFRCLDLSFPNLYLFIYLFIFFIFVNNLPLLLIIFFPCVSPYPFSLSPFHSLSPFLFFSNPL